MHGYTIVAFLPKSKGIIIYIFPKDGSGKGIVFSINHDIVPQAIGKALTGVSHDKEISKGNVTQAHNQHSRRKEERKIKKEQKTNYAKLC